MRAARSATRADRRHHRAARSAADGTPERALLQHAHEDAITVADGFLDDPQLVANARAFGYAFIRDRYLPHITLGFDARPITPVLRPHTMTVDRVVLVRFGRHGRAEEVLLPSPGGV